MRVSKNQNWKLHLDQKVPKQVAIILENSGEIPTQDKFKVIYIIIICDNILEIEINWAQDAMLTDACVGGKGASKWGGINVSDSCFTPKASYAFMQAGIMFKFME